MGTGRPPAGQEMSLIDAGDALWVVSSAAQRIPHRVPLQGPGGQRKHARSGTRQAAISAGQRRPQKVVQRLRGGAAQGCAEAGARRTRGQHLQWAFRGSAVGAETRFVRSAHYVPSGEPERATTVETRIKDKGKAEHADTPAAKRPPPRRQSNGHSGAPHSSPSGTEQASELLLEVDQLRSTVDQLPGEVSSLKGKIQSWDGTVARMASYQPGAGGARRGGSAPEESVGSGLGAH